MKRPQEIAQDVKLMGSIVQLTSIFETIASTRISQIKNQVQQSQQFFDDLWGIYSQLRVETDFRFGRDPNQPIDKKELYIVITAEGGFSGDIDQKLIELMKSQYNNTKNDIIVIGHHGALQLAQTGISFKKYFKMPVEDKNIDTSILVKEVQNYSSTTVFYQTYVSLTVQDVKRLSLGSAIQEKGKTAANKGDFITADNYILEPSSFAVADHLERSMLQIAISQLILESKLAQYASRFQAMSVAHTKADDSLFDVKLLYNRAKRSIKDERLKEIVNGLRLVRAEL